MTTPTRTIVLPGRLAPLAAAYNGGDLDLPGELVDLAARALELDAGKKGADQAVGAAERALQAAPRAAVERLRRDGLHDAPGSPVIAARRALELARDDRDVLRTAASTAAAAVKFAVLVHAVAIRSTLAAALDRVLEQARPDAPLVGTLDLRDPDAVHDAPPATAEAWHRLDELSRRHDSLRAALLALYVEVQVSRDVAPPVRAARAAFPAPEEFVGGGIVGPVPALRAVDSPDYASAWAWEPRGHPIARLARAALAATDANAEPAAGSLVEVADA